MVELLDGLVGGLKEMKEGKHVPLPWPAFARLEKGGHQAAHQPYCGGKT